MASRNPSKYITLERDDKMKEILGEITRFSEHSPSPTHILYFPHTILRHCDTSFQELNPQVKSKRKFILK